MSQRQRLSAAEVRLAVLDCVVLSIACLVAYLFVTYLAAHVYSLSKADDLVGGLWAVIATVFVFRDSYQHSVSASVTRVQATLVSFALCLIYLIFLPFHPWALAVLIGASVLAVTLIGRPEDAITAAIASAVVMVSAALSPQNAWQQPFLRLADTIIGVAIGVAAAWASLRVLRPRLGNPAGSRLCAAPSAATARSGARAVHAWDRSRSISAIPISGRITLRSCAGVSVTTTSRVGNTRPSMR